MNKLFNQIVKELSKIDEICAIILYGSFARGEATSRSDIDLFILTTEQSSLGRWKIQLLVWNQIQKELYSRQ